MEKDAADRMVQSSDRVEWVIKHDQPKRDSEDPTLVLGHVSPGTVRNPAHRRSIAHESNQGNRSEDQMCTNLIHRILCVNVVNPEAQLLQDLITKFFRILDVNSDIVGVVFDNAQVAGEELTAYMFVFEYAPRSALDRLRRLYL